MTALTPSQVAQASNQPSPSLWVEWDAPCDVCGVPAVWRRTPNTSPRVEHDGPCVTPGRRRVLGGSL